VRGRVATVDTAARELAFADGSRRAYDQLLLAVGSVARKAPWAGAAGPGLHAFVTLRDLAALDREARRGMRAVVVGGGLIGVEVAEVLRDRGLDVSFVVRERWAFPVALDEPESALVAAHLGEHGIDVRLGAAVREVQRGEDGRVRAVAIGPAGGGSDVEPCALPADLVVAAIGVVPATGFLEGSGVALAGNGGIETDDALRTSAPAVWAAGDCANVTVPGAGRRVEQLWYTAREQGRLAGRSMLGDPVVYRRSAFYNSAKFFDLEWTTAGRVPASISETGELLALPTGLRCWFQRVPGRLESQRIVLEGGRVVGFNLLGSRWDHEPLLRWIDERRSLDWVLDHLGEAQFNEELSPRFRVHDRGGAGA
jgi:NADPH-dependent 2,4-dienoyl-CoA reductase/sulfur reductase-like enzyme